MKQMQKAESLPHQWKHSEKEKTVDQQLLELLSQENWMSRSEIYEEYSYRKKDPVTIKTISKYLNELERLGELEARGRTNNRQYRKADKPVKETREDYSSPLSEGLPDFMERRIEKEVEKRVQQKMNEEIDKVEQRIEDRLIASGSATSTSEDNEGILSDEHNQEILASLTSGQWLKISEIMDDYEKRMQNPKCERTVRRRLNSLIAKGKIQKRGQKSGTEYRRREE